MQRKTLFEAMQEVVRKGQPTFGRQSQAKNPYPRQDGPPEKELSIQGLLSPTSMQRHEMDDGDD